MSKIKDEERILKAADTLSTGFPAENPQARKGRHDTYTVVLGKNPQPKVLYQARLLFRIETQGHQVGSIS